MSEINKSRESMNTVKVFKSKLGNLRIQIQKLMKLQKQNKHKRPVTATYRRVEQNDEFGENVKHEIKFSFR